MRHSATMSRCHVAFAVGEMNNGLAIAQFAALQMENVRPERHRLHLGDGSRRRALEDIADPQQQFARLERLGDVVVGADLQALDAGIGFGLRRQHVGSIISAACWRGVFKTTKPPVAAPEA